VIGRSQLDLWARGADEFGWARARHNPAQFCDVRYEDFVADPIGTVSTVYDHFGLTLTPEARAAMTAVHEASRTGERKPVHRYRLEDFGLTPEEVDERFAGYLAAQGS
jgi:LPS sulfotransferase NodH